MLYYIHRVSNCPSTYQSGPKMNFSNNLRIYRKLKRVSQTVLAELLGVSQRTISHYENGTCQPSIEGLCILADYLEVSIDELVGHTPVKKGE